MKYCTLILVALPLICLSTSACKSVEPPKTAEKTPAAKTPIKAQSTAAKKPTKTAGGGQDFAARPFKITYVKTPASVGKASKTTIELTPLAGYKMNTDFPTMMKIAANVGATAPTETISPAKEAITEAKISLAVDITPSKTGALPIQGTADFSVCNESTCKLFRKEQIAWQLDVN
ncbi:MAG: hypothetical protein VX589_17720 [Myxococcota bacterium]|nr:hypothetical protein [Myxococcota bacterium]